MKRIISLIVLIVMVLALGVAATGCKSVSSSTDGTESGKYVNEILGGTDLGAEVMEALTMQTSITAYHFDSEPSQWYKDFQEYYSEVYNGTVEYVVREWSYWNEDYIVKFAAGDAPELIDLYEMNFPTFTNRGIVYSINELEEMGVKALDHPLLMSEREVADRHFTWDGEPYSFALKMAEADMIFVNEDLFKQYGVKSPTEYYNEGLWNWGTFEKCASELTRDTDDDGTSDVYGYYGWDGGFVIGAAGGELVHLNDDGTVSAAMDLPAAEQGLANYINIWANLKCTGKVEFSTGRLGMIAWMPQNEYDRILGLGDYTGQGYTFDWSMIPYPLDNRTNTTGSRSGKSYGWCVSTLADATQAQGCINYMIAFKTFEQMNPNPDNDDYSKVFGQDGIDMINDCNRQVQLPIFQGVGNLYHTQWEFWGACQRAGATPSEIIQTYKPLFEAQCAMENNQKIER